MKKLKLLKVQFDTQISPREIPAFRGAVIQKVGLKNHWFHNHQAESGYHYRYPLIQYKCIQRQPTIMCIEDGVDEIHKFFQKSDWSLDLNGRQTEMKIARLDLNQFTMQVWAHQFNYRLHRWLALNEEAFRDYREKESLAERLSLLESILRGNILAFAKGIDWWLDKTVEVKITSLDDINTIFFKRIKMLAFNLSFQTNVFLPNHLGLGRKVSVGYGQLTELKSRHNPPPENPPSD